MRQDKIILGKLSECWVVLFKPQSKIMSVLIIKLVNKKVIEITVGFRGGSKQGEKIT